jgi:predicted nucleotidyltransferase
MPLFTDSEALSSVCRRHHIRRLSLFGSVLNGTSRPDSDVDLLVEFESDAKPTLLTMAEIELELSPPAARAKSGPAHCEGFEPVFPRGGRADGTGAI